MKVKINISNLSSVIDLRVDNSTDKCTFNGKVIDIDTKDFVKRLQFIVASWELNMIDNSIIDGERYSVTMVLDDKVREYVGINKFPLNYGQFKDLVYEVVDNH